MRELIKGKWHFIGIGGVGMSGIAKAWMELGNPVTGSDLVSSELTDRLSALGANVRIGEHDPSYITDDLEAVVVSSAIKKDNPELMEAARKGIPVIQRGICLARLMEYKKGIAIAGAHGKTTTSAMAAWLLHRCGSRPAFFVGAFIEDLAANGKWDSGEYLVAESDESDGSFLELAPHIAIVTNVEDDHLDYYGSVEKISEAFLEFINKVPDNGKVILCLDDPGVRGILPRVRGYQDSHDPGAPGRVVTYGTDRAAILRCDEPVYDGEYTRSRLYMREAPIGELVLRLHGRHNILNALGAIAAGMECGLPMEGMLEAMSEFRGADRRLELIGRAGGVDIYDDYAHHPTEIIATLSAVADLKPRRCIVAFQPHRYSRTRLLAEKFGPAFNGVDELILLPIFGAGEEPEEGVDSSLIGGYISKNRRLPHYAAAGIEDAAAIALEILRPGDLFITLGAGNIYALAEVVLKRLGEKRGGA